MVDKSRVPTQDELAKIIHVSSRPTVRTKFNYLKDHGYVIDNKKEKIYELPHIEKSFFRLPTSLIQWIINNLSEQVIKVYIYLGQRFSYKGTKYTFTIRELCQHLGLEYTHNANSVAYNLDILEKLGLIKIGKLRQGKYQYMFLEFFTTNLSIKNADDYLTTQNQ